MSKKYKILLLLSNIALFISVLNIFAKFIVFENTITNGIIIFIFCLANVAIAIKASITAAENK